MMACIFVYLLRVNKSTDDYSLWHTAKCDLADVIRALQGLKQNKRVTTLILQMYKQHLEAGASTRTEKDLYAVLKIAAEVNGHLPQGKKRVFLRKKNNVRSS